MLVPNPGTVKVIWSGVPTQGHPFVPGQVATGVDVREAGAGEQRAHRLALVEAVLHRQPAARGQPLGCAGEAGEFERIV